MGFSDTKMIHALVVARGRVDEGETDAEECETQLVPMWLSAAAAPMCAASAHKINSDTHRWRRVALDYIVKRLQSAAVAASQS